MLDPTLRDVLDHEWMMTEPVITVLDIARLGGWKDVQYWLVTQDRRRKAWLN